MPQPDKPGLFARIAAVLKPFLRFGDHYYFLTVFIIARNSISRQYRDSFLGMVWTVVQPAVQVVIYTLIFPRIMRFSTEHYVLYVIGSLLLWQFIANSLISASTSILAQSETIKRCVVPLTIFPTADVLRNFYTYAVSFVVMFGYAALAVRAPGLAILYLPVALLPVVVAVTAVSVAIAFAAPYLRDIGDLVTLALSIFFWLTPVVYPLSAMPENFRPLFDYNPFYVLIRPVISVVYDNAPPDTHMLLTQTGLTLFVVALSYGIYRMCRRNFVYYL